MRVNYKSYPTDGHPGYDGAKFSWAPVLSVQIIVGHSKSKPFEALVDSGAFCTLFHASIGERLGLDVKSGVEAPLTGIIAGASGKLYCHKTKLVLPGTIIPIIAGFSYELTAAGILGRHGFFENYNVKFDNAPTPPGLEIERFYRA